MNKTALRTSYRNAHSNFAELHARVAEDGQIIVLHGGAGGEVVWMSMSDFLEQNGQGPSCEEIMAELLYAHVEPRI